MQWVVATAAFLASAVEFVEAFTIVLVVGVTVNWRSALLGALAAAATLALLVATLGTALVQWVPLDVLRTVIGTLLLLFGLKWLKNAIMRYAGLKARHDEQAIYEETRAELRARGEIEASSPRFVQVGLARRTRSGIHCDHLWAERGFEHRLALQRHCFCCTRCARCWCVGHFGGCLRARTAGSGA